MEEHRKHERYLAKSNKYVNKKKMIISIPFTNKLFFWIFRPEYTEREKKIMLYYLIINDCIFRAKGLDIWQTMIDDGVRHFFNTTPRKFKWKIQVLFTGIFFISRKYLNFTKLFLNFTMLYLKFKIYSRYLIFYQKIGKIVIKCYRISIKTKSMKE